MGVWSEGLVGCLLACSTTQQHASLFQARISSENFTCCHTEIEVADQNFHLTQSRYPDTRPTNSSADPITSGAWQGSHWSANFYVTGMTQPGKNPCGESGNRKNPCGESGNRKNPCGESGNRKNPCGESGNRKNPCVESGNRKIPAVRAGIGKIPAVRAGIGKIPAVTAGIGKIPAVRAGIGKIPAVRAGIEAVFAALEEDDLTAKPTRRWSTNHRGLTRAVCVATTSGQCHPGPETCVILVGWLVGCLTSKQQTKAHLADRSEETNAVVAAPYMPSHHVSTYRHRANKS